jgi:L-alanine-DL-glutamate epimerase-like enolase superfamily enzyme
MVEFLIIHQERAQYFHKVKYRPEGGTVKLPGMPGLGIDLDEKVISARRELFADASYRGGALCSPTPWAARS